MTTAAEMIKDWFALPERVKDTLLRNNMPGKPWVGLRERMVHLKEEDMTPIQKDAIIYIMERRG